MTTLFQFTFPGDNFPGCGIQIEIVGKGGSPGIIRRFERLWGYTLVLPQDLHDPIVSEALDALQGHLIHAEETYIEVDELRKELSKRL